MHVAQVKNGRLTLDEPTDLPEGSRANWDCRRLHHLDDDERAELHESLRESIEQLKAAKPSLSKKRSLSCARTGEGPTWTACARWSEAPQNSVWKITMHSECGARRGRGPKL
jgi:hypothetical protein